MKNEQKKKKAPMSHEAIYRIMLCITVAVAGLFLVKNLLAKEMQGVIAIGICLAVFAGLQIALRIKKANTKTKSMVLSVSLVLLVFCISLNSGEYYSDDFPLFLAVIGMTGLYLDPRVAKIQMLCADLLLIIMYVVHPEKAESKSQYIMCLVIFTISALTFTLTIKRGRAFIEMSEERAAESEKLLDSIRTMGEELQRDFESSLVQIEGNTQELQQGSVSIINGTDEMEQSCNEAQDRIVVTDQHIKKLNEDVQNVEQSLNENRANMESMSVQLEEVSRLIKESNEIFSEMEQQMKGVAAVAAQMNNIAFNTTILSLNATIESARAGQSGAGFEVVAQRMRELSEQSNVLSKKVEDVVRAMSERVEETAQQFAGSAQAMQGSEDCMQELKRSFFGLTEQFGDLYHNIAEQNENVTQVDAMFGKLNERVADMKRHSQDNEDAVGGIVDALDIYKENINRVIEQTQNV